MVTLCLVIPFTHTDIQIAPFRTLNLLISIVIGMWLERFLIIIPSFCQPRLPYLAWRLHAFMGGMVHDCRPLCRIRLAFVLFSKFFPVISVWETEKEDREKEKMD